MSWPLVLFVVGQLALIAALIRYWDVLTTPRELIDALCFYADRDNYVYHGVTADFAGTGKSYTKPIAGPKVMADGGAIAREALGHDEGHGPGSCASQYELDIQTTGDGNGE